MEGRLCWQLHGQQPGGRSWKQEGQRGEYALHGACRNDA